MERMSKILASIVLAATMTTTVFAQNGTVDIEAVSETAGETVVEVNAEDFAQEVVQRPKESPYTGEPDSTPAGTFSLNRVIGDAPGIMPMASRSETEPNDTRVQSDRMYVGDSMSGFISSLADTDCFVFVPTTSQTVTISMTGPTSSAYDYDMWLQNDKGVTIAQSAEYYTSNESLVYNVTAGVEYYIAIDTHSGYSATLPYTVRVQTNTSGGGGVPATGALGVSKFSQQKTLWCWAAAVQMLNHYVTGTTRTQSEIVTYIHGNDNNQTGSTLDQVNALKYLNPTAFANADFWYVDLAEDFEQYVVGSFQQRKTVSLSCMPYNYSSGDVGHTLVLENIQGNTVTLIDPDPNQITNIVLTKDQLLNTGFTTKMTDEAILYAAQAVVY